MFRPARLTTIAGAALLLAAAPAAARPEQPSKVTLSVNTQTEVAMGRVTSPSDYCVVGRKVLIFRKDAGADTRLARTYASESGQFSAKAPQQSGNRIYALLRNEDVPPRGETRAHCEGDTSPPVSA